MSIRNIVKVMNFHALIRVDNAKRKADKYRMMQKQLQQMMASILYNRNLILEAAAAGALCPGLEYLSGQ